MYYKIDIDFSNYQQNIYIYTLSSSSSMNIHIYLHIHIYGRLRLIKNTGTWVQDFSFFQFYQYNVHLQRISTRYVL